MILAEGLPLIGGPLQNRGRLFTMPYIRFTGLWQTWDMFAPNPWRVDGSIDAVVTYQNGVQKLWTVPVGDSQHPWRTMREQTYLRWTLFQMKQSSAPLWPDLADYVRRSMTNDPAVPPVRIELRRHWAYVYPKAPISKSATGGISTLRTIVFYIWQARP